MSAEDEDLRWIRSELAKLSRGAKGPENLGAAMIDRLAAGYEDRIAAERVVEIFARRNWKQRLWGVLRREPVPDARVALCSTFVDALFARGNRSLSGVLFPLAPTRNNPSHVHEGGAGSDQGDSDQQQVAAA